MGCSSIITGSFAVLTILFLGTALSPNVFWSSQPAENDSEGHKISLWKQCDLNSTSFTKPENCISYGSEGRIRGAQGGCVLAVLCSCIAVSLMCCRFKKLTVFAMFLSALSVTIVIGCWVNFMADKADAWESDAKEAVKTADVGLALAACAFVTTYLGFISSFCLPGRDSYQQIA